MEAVEAVTFVDHKYRELRLEMSPNYAIDCPFYPTRVVLKERLADLSVVEKEILHRLIREADRRVEAA